VPAKDENLARDGDGAGVQVVERVDAVILRRDCARAMTAREAHAEVVGGPDDELVGVEGILPAPAEAVEEIAHACAYVVHQRARFGARQGERGLGG
jgi:hypothetical protein